MQPELEVEAPSAPTRAIGYGRQSISDADVDAVVRVLRGERLTQGPAVPRFEAAVRAFLDRDDEED